MTSESIAATDPIEAQRIINIERNNTIFLFEIVSPQLHETK